MSELRTYGLATAREQLGDVVSRAAIGGQVTVITRNGRPAAAVVPLSLLPPEIREQIGGDDEASSPP
ncbi:type II toxin-antitoxin system Phd/YefM family antitoxin [Jiangella aurantiaca]|uniref:type II toxin-antitoxin system Phd/YefM family antitoxin n=1 Tax=Jiangella aurantiaca TaxID=2530373 RepID=UPI001EF10753|nr:type II toxin-antitoxin system Phd/YefM family antitoxin [Jiangella aurantiaca]